MVSQGLLWLRVVAMLAQHGPMYDQGVASVKFRIAGQDMLEEAEVDDPKLVKAVKDNVIRVDFGTEQ